MRFRVFYLFIFFCLPALLQAQKKVYNNGIGISYNAIAAFTTNRYNMGGKTLPQIQYVYLPAHNKLITVGFGVYAKKEEGKPFFRPPVWLTGNYLHLHKYDKKKKVHFIYGGRFDIGIGYFPYATYNYGPYSKDFYKRVLLSIGPQAGFLIKTGKRSFITTSFSVGAGTLFSKVTQAPENAYHSNRLFIPVYVYLEYNYLFGKKKKR